MIAALALLGYAALLLTAGAGALARARWPHNAPALGIAAWFALTGSAVASVLGAVWRWSCRRCGSAPTCLACWPPA